MVKISKTSMDKMIKFNSNRVHVVDIPTGPDSNVSVELYRDISMDEFRSAVAEMADIQFAIDESGNEVYDPTLHEFAMRYIRMKYYTNIPVDVSGSSNNGRKSADPKMADKVWQLYNLAVDAYLDSDPDWVWASDFSSLTSAADQIVDQKRDILAPVKIGFWTRLADLVESAEKEFGSLTNGELSETMDAIRKLSNLDEETIGRLMLANKES